MERELSAKRFAAECDEDYIGKIRKFLMKGVVQQLATVRKDYGMFDAMVKNAEGSTETDLSMGTSGKFLRKLLYCIHLRRCPWNLQRLRRALWTPRTRSQKIKSWDSSNHAG